MASLVLPALVGLLAGVGHGVMSHQANLPLSLGQQMVSILQPPELP
ncbi:MAG: hypothetical protein F6K04_23930 [Leptolyngbya sp. SIO4C5]|nr:hypothetical protein [Leptolyngbya sp. SIO4C5]